MTQNNIWLVIGAGTSGYGASKLLRSLDETVFVSDSKTLAPDNYDRFDHIGAKVYRTEQGPTHLSGITNIVISPGIASDHPLLHLAQAKGIPIMSEIDLALSHYRGQVAYVTGTNGKSTTVVMIEHFLLESGKKTVAVGNLGTTPSEVIADGVESDQLIVEVSSYQLEQSSRVSPSISVFTSFSEDHLQRHKNIKNYFKIKWNGIRRSEILITTSYVIQSSIDLGIDLNTPSTEVPPNQRRIVLVLDSGFEVLDGWEPAYIEDSRTEKNLIFQSNKWLLASSRDVSFVNLINSALATLTCSLWFSGLKITPHHLLKTFKGLPYRCQKIGTYRGLDIINDSKSTNVESVLAALSGYQNKSLLLLGGQGKGESFLPVLKLIDKIDVVFAFGKESSKIEKEIGTAVTVRSFTTLSQAMDQVLNKISKNPISVIFSPGCASFDEFQNFEACMSFPPPNPHF